MALKQAHPQRQLEVWAEDEARLGLKPVVRRVWARRGQRPRSNGQRKFVSRWVFGFVHPATGRSWCQLLPQANTPRMTEAVADFARWADPTDTKLLVVLVDNAGWHVAKSLQLPANVVLHRLPPCTPELQPAEPLWPLVREVLANRFLKDLEEVERLVRTRCDWLANQPEVVRGAVGFQWLVSLTP